MAAQVALRRQQAQEESEARELQFMYTGSGAGETGLTMASGVQRSVNTVPRISSYDVFGTDDQKDGELVHRYLLVLRVDLKTMFGQFDSFG